MVETYDSYINGLKDGIAKECDAITDTIKDKFKEAGIDFSTFNLDIKETILKVFNKEIAF